MKGPHPRLTALSRAACLRLATLLATLALAVSAPAARTAEAAQQPPDDLLRFDAGTSTSVGAQPVRMAPVDVSKLDGARQVPPRFLASGRDSRWSNEFGPADAGLDGTVWSLLSWDGSLYAGGTFTRAGQTAANNIARWDGESWNVLADGFDGTVFVMAVYHGDLIAGGTFTRSGEQPVRGIARWDSHQWVPLGSGVGGSVRALEIFRDQLIAAGDFYAAGGVPAGGIAAWDGSTWTPLGSGGGGGYLDPGVRALVAYGDVLIAGGFFLHAGGIQAEFVASWDGNSWAPVGTGHPGVNYALTLYQGDLYGGGVVWHNPSEGTWRDIVRRWSGSAWLPLGDGTLVAPFANGVRAYTEYRGDLVIAGQFPNAADVPVGHVARSAGGSWVGFGSGLDAPAYAAAVHEGSLYVGGDFTLAGGKPSAHIAKWTDDARGRAERAPLSLRAAVARGSGVDLQYTIDRPGTNVRLDVYDLLGRRVRTLVSGSQDAGTYDMTWDRRDGGGKQVAAGIYIARLVAEGRSLNQKLLLLR